MRNPHKKPTSEQRKAWDAKHYQAHKKEIQAIHKMYRDCHVEQSRQYNRDSYYRNHERSLQLKRLNNNKRIFREQVAKLTDIFQPEDFTINDNVKLAFLSMIRSEIYLGSVGPCEGITPDIKVQMTNLYNEVKGSIWEVISQDKNLKNRMREYVLNANYSIYENLTI